MSVDLLIPRPLESERSQARFYHWDIPEFTASQLWAETVTLGGELARRIALRIPPQVLTAPPDCVSDREWMIARLGALQAEMRRRGYKDAADRRHPPSEGV